MEKNLIDSWGIFEKDVFSNNFNTLKNLFHDKETSTFLELLDKVHKIAGMNTSEQLNNLLNAFKEFGKIELTEKELVDLTEEEREEKITIANEKAEKTENLKLDDLIKSIK